MDNQWSRNGASLVTDDMNKFMESAKKSKGCMLFVDESGEMIGRYKDETFWLATRSRHLGHVSHFISQRYVDVSKTVRDQCSHLITFRVANDDAKYLATIWAQPELELASKLDKYQFIYCTRFSKPRFYQSTLNGVVELKHGLASSSRTDNTFIN